MINVILCSYNNYYNRIIKKLDSVAEYRTSTYPKYIDLENINFNPADGVTTDLIVGKGTGMFLNWEKGGPDYCVVYEKNNNVETILSRWFIMDEDRTRSGQYKISLKRDVLADNIENLETSPIYVEKGIINDITSPLLCNNESLQVNQIKKQEILLKDKSQCPWLVMYLKKGVLGSTSVGTSGKVTIDVPAEVNVYETLSTPITNWGYYQYTTNDFEALNTNTFIVKWKESSGALTQTIYEIKANGSVGVTYAGGARTNLVTVNVTQSNLTTVLKPRLSALTNTLRSDFGFGNLSVLLQYNDKIIKDSTGKYFKVSCVSNAATTSVKDVTSSSAPNLKVALNSAWNDANNSSQTANDYAFQTRVTITPYRLVINELTDVETTVDFSTMAGKGTLDNPLYDVITMPYGEVTEFIGTEVSQEVITSKERSLRIMNSIATQLSGNYVLDLQVLPYCPVQDVLNDYYDEEGKIAILDETLELVLFAKNGQGYNTDAILVCPSTNFTFDINRIIRVTDDSEVSDVFKTKYLNDCTLVRLCSPNYNGVFEMNLAKNGGQISRFNVDMTLRPMNPYIHVNPDFNFLYGQDFNDVRGLICGGDFSLGIINDAWVQYEIQNKNYQAIFDRQVQNLDVNNSIARQEALWQLGAGTVQGAATGATAGFMASGSPWGAVAGAAIGGVSSGIGGALDYSNLERRQRETKDYSIDNFNLQLGNVRALPNSITKTSALTYNNKLFPFVEVYECSEEEKQAYYSKLTYDGMTVGKIDTMSNYTGGFFKGQLIRNESLQLDNHMMSEINNELMKGVYI